MESVPYYSLNTPQTPITCVYICMAFCKIGCHACVYVCVCAYIIATNIVIFCISSVQISTTVLRELPLYWANGIKGLSV